MKYNLDEKLLASTPYRILPWDVIKNLRATSVLSKPGACEAYRKIGARLLGTCMAKDGVGIAAPQVGVFKSAFLIREFGRGDDGNIVPLLSFRLYLNPKWVGVPEGGQTIDVEHCLSVAGAGIAISRFNVIEATWEEFDEKDNLVPMARVFEGQEARIVQHESDHLLGISIPQRFEMQNNHNKNKTPSRKKAKRKRRA